MSNSLQNSLCARDVIDQIVLSLNSEMGGSLIYVLVEGKDDCKIYAKFFNSNEPPRGKPRGICRSHINSNNSCCFSS